MVTQPVVLGAGPAGSTAATLLARAGAEPILIDRDANVGDTICGGFLSWKTAEALRELGCDPGALGARKVRLLRLIAGDRVAEAALPEPAFGLSRRSLDGALRGLAQESGARLEIDRARVVGPGRIVGDREIWEAPAIFLATGKHDVRGESRPRESVDPALGLRVRLPPTAKLEALVGDAIELHLFWGGYAGIVLQENGSANICLALRKSLLAKEGPNPWSLLRKLAGQYPHFAERLDLAVSEVPVDTIGSVPYGWIARETEEGLFRLGDQAAVIPSLAGEGMAIALASARAAVNSYISGESAPTFQRTFAARARRPLAVAGLLWHLSESTSGAKTMTALAGRLPFMADLAMRLSRI